MIKDVETTVTTDKGTYDIIITGQQLEQTIRRRMNTLAPKERVIDIVQRSGAPHQGDSSNTAGKQPKLNTR